MRKPKKPPKKITEDYLHNAGLYYLQRFAASRASFRAVMIRKIRKSCAHHQEQDFEKCAEMVEALIKKFERAGLLDDKLYAQGLASSLRRRGKSRRAITAKMAVKGLSSGEAETALESADSELGENAEEHAAREFARKKRLGKNPAKDLAAMARAGFSYGLAKKILGAKEEEID